MAVTKNESPEGRLYGRTYRAYTAHVRTERDTALCSEKLALTLESFTEAQLKSIGSHILPVCRRCQKRAAA